MVHDDRYEWDALDKGYISLISLFRADGGVSGYHRTHHKMLGDISAPEYCSGRLSRLSPRYDGGASPRPASHRPRRRIGREISTTKAMSKMASTIIEGFGCAPLHDVKLHTAGRDYD